MALAGALRFEDGPLGSPTTFAARQSPGRTAASIGTSARPLLDVQGQTSGRAEKGTGYRAGPSCGRYPDVASMQRVQSLGLDRWLSARRADEFCDPSCDVGSVLKDDPVAIGCIGHELTEAK